jgi:hypothetical protein
MVSRISMSRRIVAKGLVDELRELDQLNRLLGTRNVDLQLAMAQGDTIRPVWERFKELCRKVADEVREPSEDPKALAEWLSWNVRGVAGATFGEGG